MARMRFGGAGSLVEGLYPHFSHQGGDMPATDTGPVLSQQIPQHPAAGKGIRKMQSVDQPHQLQICC